MAPLVRFVLAALLSLTPALVSAQAATYEVRPQAGSRIRFTSDAPLETMTGTSQAVSGEFTVDPANLAAARGSVSVPIASLRTGIDLRDQHLRSDTWLDAGRFPEATFEVTGVSGAARLEEGREARVRLSGRFTLHGRTRQVTASARVKLEAGVVTVRARFTVHLADYGVSIPEVVQLKVSEDIVVDVQLRGSRRG